MCDRLLTELSHMTVSRDHYRELAGNLEYGLMHANAARDDLANVAGQTRAAHDHFRAEARRLEAELIRVTAAHGELAAAHRELGVVHDQAGRELSSNSGIDVMAAHPATARPDDRSAPPAGTTAVACRGWGRRRDQRIAEAPPAILTVVVALTTGPWTRALELSNRVTLVADTIATNTIETARARPAIFAWVLPLALIREWFMARPLRC